MLIVPLQAQPGSLDPTYNPTFNWQPPGSRVLALAAQSDDKLLIGGGFQTVDGTRRVALFRLFDDGRVDTSFQQRNPDGSDVFSSVSSIAVETGDLVVAGGVLSGNGTIGVARFNSDGTRDTSYDPSNDPSPFAIRQSGGKLLIVDSGRSIKRLNPDGGPDPSFNSIQLGGGFASDSSNITAVAVQPNDRIVVATLTGRPFSDHGHVFRLQSDGNWDDGFTPASADIDIPVVAVQPDGRIVIAGPFSTVNGVPRSGLARLMGDKLGDKPLITSQPVDRVTPIGGRVSFSIAVTSFDIPAFRWQFNGTDIPGATNRVLELVDVRLDQAGDYEVVVKNAFGTVESTTARLVVLAAGCPTPSFGAPRTFDAGENPNSVAVGDFNGDGKLDLAAANSAADTISVLLGNGDGSFQTAIPYGAGPNPGSIAAGDFNGDGKPDVVVANLDRYDQSSGSYTNGGVSVFLGKGDGTFHDAVKYKLGPFPTFPVSVAVGDFNGDGKPDVALAHYQSSRVSVLLGRGDGSFQDAVRYDTGATVAAPVPSGIYSVMVGDFNADGKPDVIVTNPGKVGDILVPGSLINGSLSVLLGNGDGSFQAPLKRDLPSFPYSAAVDDFNRDGRIDLAVASFGSSIAGAPSIDGVSILLGNGDGTFRDPVNFGAGAQPVIVAVSDFNGDGQPDLAVANQGGGSISVRLGNGDGTFGDAVNFSAGAQPVFVAAADFNGDGQPDLAVASGSSSLLLNTCDSIGAQLSVFRGDGNVTISWPLSSIDYVCESTTDLSSTNWQAPAELVVTNNGRLEVTVPLDPAQRFFRLRKP